MVPSLDPPLGDPLPARRRPCILVVEDELLIRLMTSEELRDAGYGVIEACNADEALVVLGSGVHVDLVFTDVRMPGSTDGLGLLGYINTNFQTLPVILTSGHLTSQEARASGAVNFLAKPYLLEMVVSAVQDELTRSA